MKFIFVVITVCIFVLSPSYAVEKYHINPVDANNHEDHAFFKTDFEYGLLQRFLGRKTAIVQSWMDCKKKFNSPTEEKDIFKNPETNSVRDMTDTGKCLMDCTMRKTGVLNDNGLNEEQYMLQIKQLRYNYTSFDINKESQDDRDWVLDVIADRAVLLENYQNVRQNAWFDYTCHRKSPHRNLCNDLIQSYAQAARKCKNLKDSKGNKCETAFKIMSCIVEENGKNSFNAPFFPLKWITLEQF